MQCLPPGCSSCTQPAKCGLSCQVLWAPTAWPGCVTQKQGDHPALSSQHSSYAGCGLCLVPRECLVTVHIRRNSSYILRVLKRCSLPYVSREGLPLPQGTLPPLLHSGTRMDSLFLCCSSDFLPDIRTCSLLPSSHVTPAFSTHEVALVFQANAQACRCSDVREEMQQEGDQGKLGTDSVSSSRQEADLKIMVMTISASILGRCYQFSLPL